MVDRNGWGASAVDALSTALVLEEWDVVDQILEYIPTINFDNTTTVVSLFETTIRYLGGLVSGKACILNRPVRAHLTSQPTTSSTTLPAVTSNEFQTWRPS